MKFSLRFLVILIFWVGVALLFLRQPIRYLCTDVEWNVVLSYIDDGFLFWRWLLQTDAGIETIPRYNYENGFREQLYNNTTVTLASMSFTLGWILALLGKIMLLFLLRVCAGFSYFWCAPGTTVSSTVKRVWSGITFQGEEETSPPSELFFWGVATVALVFASSILLFSIHVNAPR